jgi:hypothetical protein
MSSNRQFVACKFRPTDTRCFTYHWDGEEQLADGDVVRVPDRSGDGWKKVYVADANAEEPTGFPTKAILGRHVEEVPTQLDTAARDAA